jgi:hypothetical protein
MAAATAQRGINVNASKDSTAAQQIAPGGNVLRGRHGQTRPTEQTKHTPSRSALTQAYATEIPAIASVLTVLLAMHVSALLVRMVAQTMASA